MNGTIPILTLTLTDLCLVFPVTAASSLPCSTAGTFSHPPRLSGCCYKARASKDT